jgi:hypothetical protein
MRDTAQRLADAVDRLTTAIDRRGSLWLVIADPTATGMP